MTGGREPTQRSGKTSVLFELSTYTLCVGKMGEVSKIYSGECWLALEKGRVRRQTGRLLRD